jgi:hypothetical protein
MSFKDSAVAKLQVLAYETLSVYFLKHHNKVIEIEILPPSIQPRDGISMQDGLSLGVPKKILALAFVEARRHFFENIRDDGFQAMAMVASKVILLHDPEYLTAANFRKRRILTLKDDDTAQSQTAFRKAVQHEFCFLDSILTSPLHRHTKSPTLWSHRLWLLDLLSPKGLKNAPTEHRARFCRAELDAVRKSGERHPKNYYAWQYARRLMDRISDEDVKFDFAHQVKDWCCMHPSDTSGWSCLFYLITRLGPLSQRQALVEDVLEYAIRLLSEHESLWVFLRTILAHDTLQDKRLELITTLGAYSKELTDRDEVSDLAQRVSQTLDWINTYRRPTEQNLLEEVNLEPDTQTTASTNYTPLEAIATSKPNPLKSAVSAVITPSPLVEAQAAS